MFWILIISLKSFFELDFELKRLMVFLYLYSVDLVTSIVMVVSRNCRGCFIPSVVEDYSSLLKRPFGETCFSNHDLFGYLNWILNLDLISFFFFFPANMFCQIWLLKTKIKYVLSTHRSRDRVFIFFYFNDSIFGRHEYYDSWLT